MKSLARVLLITGLSLTSLCCDRKTSGGSSSSTSGSSTASPSGSPATRAAVMPTAQPSPTASTGPDDAIPVSARMLLKAEDVLPEGEVSKGSLVVFGDGYRFQIKPAYKPVPHPTAKTAYSGTIEGLIEPAVVTLYVTKEPFTGDLDALKARHLEALKAKSARLGQQDDAMVFVEGSRRSAARVFDTVDDKLELQVMTVHDGNAWTFHAETPAKPIAFANVGSDMMIRASTFHVAPPPAKTK